MDLSIVIPVYNSADILPELIESIDHELNATSLAFEMILVNDGSKDKSLLALWQNWYRENRGRLFTS